MLRTPELLGVVLAVCAALLTAITAVCLRIGTDRGGANDALVVVLLCNIALLVPAALVRHYPAYGVTGRSFGAFVLAGLVGTMLGRACYYASIERIGAGPSDAIKASQPLHATLIALVVLGETLTTEHLLGILLVVVGIGIVSREIAPDRSTAAARKRFAVALVFPLGAALFYGIEPTFARIGFAEGTPVLVGLSLKTVAATAGFLGYLRWRGSLPAPSGLADGNLRWYLAAGLANTGFLAFYYAALEIARVNIVVPLVQTSPFFVLVLSVVFLRRLERVTWGLVGAASCVVSGAILIVVYV